MSFKYQAVKHTDNHYVLPKVANMKCDVHAFLSEKLYNLSEENVWLQASNAASYPGVTDVFLLPDTHGGFGVPIGSVVITEDTIIQAANGYDISCGISYIRFPKLFASDIASWDKRVKLIKEIERRLTFGIGSARSEMARSFSTKDVEGILRYGAQYLGIDANLCERQYIPIPEDLDLNKIEKAYVKAGVQLGSIGSGNHYCEVQCDEETGEVWVMIHCGSRGYGYQTANDFFYRAAELRGLPKNERENSWLRMDEPLGKEYWGYVNSAANYAIANRHIIIEAVKDAMKTVFKTEGHGFYEISHNLAQEETIVLPNGETRKGLVHRKGATRAFPAGHPDLIGTKWAETGHPCLIPGSMRDGAAILFPRGDMNDLSGAYKSGCSVNHGSGRLLGRKDAKRKLADKQQWIDNDMATVTRKLGGTMVRGIVTNTKKTPLDECSKVYKNLDDVLSVLEAEGIATVDKRLFPVANLKSYD